MPQTVFGFETIILYIIFVSCFFGGIVKGICGVGLPIITISILINYMPPHETLAIVIAPIVITNLWLALKANNIIRTIRIFAPLILCFVPVLALTAYFVVSLEKTYLFAGLGVSVIVFSLSNLIHPPLRPMSPTTQKWLAPIAGGLGGILGGVSTIWGPPIMMYLVLLRLPKDTFVQIVGVIWSIGSIPLTISYWANGMINQTTFPLSVFACFPGMIGIFTGELIRKYITQDLFRKILMLTLLLIGLNLLKKSVLQIIL